MKRDTKSGGRKRYFRRALTALGACAVAGFVAYLAWPKPIKVEAVTVGRGTLVVSVVEEGKTRIRHRYTVSSPVSGFLNRTPLRPGDAVKAGEGVLAVIETEPSGLLTPRLRASAEAQLKTAEAARSLRRAELDRANVALDLARKQFERLDRLMPSGGVSQQEWDIAESRMQVGSREAKAAEFALRMSEFEVQQAASLLIQGGESSGAESVRILSPVDGYVLQVREESARTVVAGTPIMEVGDPEDLEGEVDLFSTDAASVPVGAEVLIDGWGGEEPLRGRVTLVERSGFTKVSALGVEEQRVKVRIDFTDPVPHGYRLGDRYRIQVRIVLRREDDALLIPLGALFRRGGDWTTFRIVDEKAASTRVEIGQNDGRFAEILSGLDEGDSVILYPPEQVKEGVTVSRE